jgi:hydrogenase expression/formation protein HypE
MFINTTGIGSVRDAILRGDAAAPAADAARPGDAVIVNGALGDHHACILSARLGIKNGIESDCAALNDVADALYAADFGVHAMRDVTRGGLAAVLNEIAVSSGVRIALDEGSIPVSDAVAAFCGVMGLDPLCMGNEGKMVAIVDGARAEAALSAMRATAHGKGSRIIGHVAREGAPGLVVRTHIGGTRRVPVPQGEGLPRIC